MKKEISFVVSKVFCIFASENFYKNMTQLVLNIEDVGILPSLKRVLASINGISISSLPRMSKKTNTISAEKQEILDSIKCGYREYELSQKTNTPMPQLSNLIDELRSTATS